MAFRFLAEARLYKYLGEYDAFVQLEEVAIRRFVAAIDRSSAPREFVLAEAREHGINVTVVPTDAFIRNAARTNIIVAYQSADQYLSEFEAEHELLRRCAWAPKVDRQSAFDHLIRSLGVPVQDVEREVGKLRIEIYDYYRLVRNLASHRYDPDDEDRWGTTDAERGRERRKLDSKLKRIGERYEEELPEFRGRLAAPNSYDQLTFDDFILATRNIKHIATALSKVGQPTDEELLEGLQVAVARFYRKEPHNPDRVRRRIASEACSRFGVDRAHADHIASLWLEPAAR